MKKRIAIYVLVLLAIVGIVWAADVKISDMPLESHPDGGDLVPIVDVSGSTNRRTTIVNLMRSGLTVISGATLDWTSGVTLPYLAAAPDLDSGESSYVLTARGVGQTPIWTNAVGGSGSNVFASGVTTSGVTIYHNLTAFDKTPLFISTDHDNTSGISIYSTVHNGKIGITIYNDAAEWQVRNDGADGGTLKFLRNGVEAFELDATNLITSGMISAGGNISGETLYSYATNSIGGLYLYTKSVAGKYVLIKIPGDLAADYILTLPGDDGNAGEFLTTDGSGTLSWSAAGAGDVTKAMLDGHTNATAFSGTTWFVTHTDLAANTVTVSGASGAVTKTTLDDHTNNGAFSGTSNFALKAALTASNELVAFSGATWFVTHPEMAANTLVVSGTSLNLSSGITTTSGVTVGTILWPDTNDGATLGWLGMAWSDLYLASGSVINWNSGDVTATHAADSITFDIPGGGVGTFAITNSNGASNSTNLDVKGGILSGRDDSLRGSINLYSNANEDGGQINLYVGGDYDDTINYYSLNVLKQQFEIGPSTNTNLFTITGSGITVEGGVSANVLSGLSIIYSSGVTGDYLIGAPNFQSGESSYVLTSIGQNKIPIWTNAPSGTGSGDVTKATLDGHTDNGAFSGTSNFALKAALTASNEAAAFSGTTGFALKTALTASTDLAAFSGTTGFATHSNLASHTTTLSGTSGEATKTMLDNHTNPAAFSGTSNFALKAALTASNEAAAFSGTTWFMTHDQVAANTVTVSGASGTVTKATLDAHTNNGAISGVSIEWSGTTLGYLANPPDFDSSGTSGSVLVSGASGTRPNWATELNIALTTTGAQQVNRILYFDANGTMSGATNISYSGVTNTIDFSGTTVVIRSGTSPDYVCQTGTLYLDTDADTNGSLYLCVATGQWKEMDDDGGAVEVTKALLDGHTNDGAFSGTSNFALKAALTAAVAADAFSGTSGFALKTALTASTNANVISGTSIDWTSGTTLPNLIGVPDFDSGTSSYVLTARGVGVIPIWTNLPSTTAEVSKAMLDGHTNAEGFSGTTAFALKSALTASTNSLSGVSGEATKAQLASHTDAAAYESSTGGVSNFATKAATTTALNAASFSGTTGFALKTALTASTDLAAFSGTTGFATHTALAANTVALSGVSGEATKAQLNTHTDAAAYASSTGGVSNFATKAALTASTGSAVVSGTSIDWTSGTSLQYIAGATSFIQTQIIAISGNSNTLSQEPTSKVVGKLVYDIKEPLIYSYGATGSGTTEWVISAVTDSLSFVISGVTHGKNNAAPWGTTDKGQDDIILWQPPYKIQVKEVFGITDSGATVVWNLQNCNSAGASCVDMLSPNLGSGNTGVSKGTIIHSDVSPYETMKLNVIWSGVSTPSGVTANFTGIVNYWKARR